MSYEPSKFQNFIDKIVVYVILFGIGLRNELTYWINKIRSKND